MYLNCQMIRRTKISLHSPCYLELVFIVRAWQLVEWIGVSSNRRSLRLSSWLGWNQVSHEGKGMFWDQAKFFTTVTGWTLDSPRSRTLWLSRRDTICSPWVQPVTLSRFALCRLGLAAPGVHAWLGARVLWSSVRSSVSSRTSEVFPNTTYVNKGSDPWHRTPQPRPSRFEWSHLDQTKFLSQQ